MCAGPPQRWFMSGVVKQQHGRIIIQNVFLVCTRVGGLQRHNTRTDQRLYRNVKVCYTRCGDFGIAESCGEYPSDGTPWRPWCGNILGNSEYRRCSRRDIYIYPSPPMFLTQEIMSRNPSTSKSTQTSLFSPPPPPTPGSANFRCFCQTDVCNS